MLGDRLMRDGNPFGPPGGPGRVDHIGQALRQ